MTSTSRVIVRDRHALVVRDRHALVVRDRHALVVRDRHALVGVGGKPAGTPALVRRGRAPIVALGAVLLALSAAAAGLLWSESRDRSSVGGGGAGCDDSDRAGAGRDRSDGAAARADVPGRDGADASTAGGSARGAGLRPAAGYGNIALSFEPNVGQTDPRAGFLARGPGYTVFLSPVEATLALRSPGPRDGEPARGRDPARAADGQRRPGPDQSRLCRSDQRHPRRQQVQGPRRRPPWPTPGARTAM